MGAFRAQSVMYLDYTMRNKQGILPSKQWTVASLWHVLAELLLVVITWSTQNDITPVSLKIPMGCILSMGCIKKPDVTTIFPLTLFSLSSGVLKQNWGIYNQPHLSPQNKFQGFFLAPMSCVCTSITFTSDLNPRGSQMPSLGYRDLRQRWWKFWCHIPSI